MEYVYTALLLHKAQQEINEENMKKVLTAAGVKPEESRIKALLAALENVNIDEVIKEASVAQVVQVGSQPAEVSNEEKNKEKEEKKKEEEEKKTEEEAAAGLGSLFG